MKKSTWIALGLLAVSVLFFVLVQRSPGESPGPGESIPIGDGLLRIEINGPAGEDRPERIIFDRRRGQWWLTEPVESPLAESVNREFAAVFGRDIGLDDLMIEGSRAEDLGLGEAEAVKVIFTDANKERGPIEVWVGQEIVIPQTGARRTFIMKKDREAIYRAHGGFGELLRRPLSELRSRSIISIGEEGMRRISLRHGDGHHLDLEWSGEGWRHVEEGLNLKVDQSQAARLVNRLGRLQALGFYQGSAEGAGLENPAIIVTVTAGEGEIKLEIGRVDEAGQPRFFARHQGGETIFELTIEDGELLSWRTSDVRDRAILGIGSNEIQEISLVDETGIALIRDGQGWAVRGEPAGELELGQVESLAQFIAGLRAREWVRPEKSLSADEIFLESRKISLLVGEERTLLEIGSPVEEGSSLRYARYSKQDGLFILGESAWRRLTEGGLVKMVATVEESLASEPELGEMTR